ncbi:MAG: hypothetical protein RTU63_00515, partial [Candidatus Thorarchaeota archaeon]
MPVLQAAETVMSELRQKTSGEAGLILADTLGNVAIKFDTPHLPVAVASSELENTYCAMSPVWPID